MPPSAGWLVLWAELGPSHRTGPAGLASLGRAPALMGRRLGRTTTGGVGPAERRTGHRAVAARGPVALERRARSHPLANRRRLIDRWHQGHRRRRRLTCRRPSGLLTPVVPTAMPALCTHVVRLRAAHLSCRLPRPVVPPPVAAARRALAQMLAAGHPVQRAQWRQRLRGHGVWLGRK